MDIPRPEYPRPQFVRNDWLCLNGPWEFEIDAGDSGLERGLLERPLQSRILVPFCPESKLSGVEHVDFMAAVWYRRQADIPAAWAGRRIRLHIGACDYDTTVWVNGVEVGRHRGGFTPIACELSGAAEPGSPAVIVIRARDDNESAKPRGKQSRLYHNHSCHYTRTTGIWQTVWLEPLPAVALERPRITPDLAGRRFHLQQPISGRRPAGLRLRATLTDPAGVVCAAETDAVADFCPALDLPIPADRVRLWDYGQGNLYGLRIELLDDKAQVVDAAESYAGLRSVTMDGLKMLLNGRPVFQRLVLDQGFYPDGVLTAPSDADLVRDIELSMQAGFNGARLHQKVFEERFLYHADRLGYPVWGEFGDWGCGGFGPPENQHRMDAAYVTQWLEALHRDYSHPCIIGWCPLNEIPQSRGDRIHSIDDAMLGMFLATKAIDATRPVLDVSGFPHRVPETDVYDSHDYEQDVAVFTAHHAGTAEGKPLVNGPAKAPWSTPYRGQPVFVSEFGGMWWNPDAAEGADSWGYGQSPRSLEEFYQRFEGLCRTLLDNPGMFGYCYTQLTDVHQEQNGIYTFDRRPKFDIERIRQIQEHRAAVEAR